MRPVLWLLGAGTIGRKLKAREWAMTASMKMCAAGGLLSARLTVASRSSCNREHWERIAFAANEIESKPISSWPAKFGRRIAPSR